MISRGATEDNAGNLSAAYLETVYGLYGNTSIARQELFGELLDEVDGALWFENMLNEPRVSALPIGVPLRVIGVDPTVAERPGDECGIVVCAASAERDLFKREAWVLDDRTVQGSPETWASRVVETARRWQAPVVAETNQGGALVAAAIHAIDPGIPIFEVHSRYGKRLRAEPVALAYEQGRVHHVGVFAELEDQLLNWEPTSKTARSPDRLDALVHALTALLISPPRGLHGGRITATAPSGSLSVRATPGRPRGATAVTAGPYGARRGGRLRVINLEERGRGRR